MRLILAGLIALPSFAVADSFNLATAPSAVTLYQSGAVVTRETTMAVPVGSHELVLQGLPQWLNPSNFRVSVVGATLRQTQFRDTALPPQDDADSAAVVAAKDAIEAAELALKQHDDQVAMTRLPASAAQAKVQFLSALGQNDALPTNAEALRELSEMIERETLVAKQNALTAEHAARDQNEAREDLEEQWRDAQAALAALTPPPEETSLLTLSIEAAAASDVTVALTYFVDQAGWGPVYDIYLTGNNPSQIEFRRGALVGQYSGENWDQVAMTFSTLEPTSQIAPGDVHPWLRRIEDKPKERPQMVSRLGGAVEDLSEPMLEMPVIVEDSYASASFDGPGVTYNAPNPVSVATNAEGTRVPLGNLVFDAKRVAVAVPSNDETAFLMARYTNTTKEPILASEQAMLYLDSAFIGEVSFAHVPAGAEADTPFGPIETLRISRTILDENNGDRGFISRSNALTEKKRLDIENLGDVDMQLEVTDRVPYSIDEDLEITWTASPTPDVTDVDDKRGVLQWNIDVPAGTTTSIKIDQDLQWPDDKVLR